MRWLIYGCIAVLGVAALCLVIGILLPKAHVATRAANFQQSPEELFALISGPQGWRPELAKAEEVKNPGGPRMWREYSRHGDSVTFEETASEPPRLYQTRIADKNLPFGGTWTWRLTRAATGTDVRITENGEVYNPVFRFVSRFILGYSKTMDDYLHGMAKQLNESISVHE